MPDIPLPEDLSTYIRGMESRIRALETAPRAQDTTLPWSYSFVDLAETTSSTTYVDLATAGPTVTVTVGRTGRVFVNVGSYVDVPAGAQGTVGLFVDGFFVRDVVTLRGASNTISNPATTRVITNLSAGLHTFTLKYRSVTGALLGFGARFLTVQPF
jgi:hypothetical protein